MNHSRPPEDVWKYFIIVPTFVSFMKSAGGFELLSHLFWVGPPKRVLALLICSISYPPGVSGFD